MVMEQKTKMYNNRGSLIITYLNVYLKDIYRSKRLTTSLSVSQIHEQSDGLATLANNQSDQAQLVSLRSSCLNECEASALLT